MNDAPLLLIATVIIPIGTLSQAEQEIAQLEMDATEAIHEFEDFRKPRQLKMVDREVLIRITRMAWAAPILHRSDRIGRLVVEDRLHRYRTLIAQRLLDKCVAAQGSVSEANRDRLDRKISELSYSLDETSGWPEIYQATMLELKKERDSGESPVD